MSAISSIPSDVLIQIFYQCPTSDIITAFRQTCKSWEAATNELSLWHRFGDQFSIERHTNATEMEAAVKNWVLKRSIVISTNDRLLEKLKSFFLSILEGDTRAVYYRSASNSNTFGFYIETRSDDISKELNGLQCEATEGVSRFFHKLENSKTLTITGKNEADCADDSIYMSSRYSAHTRAVLQNINFESPIWKFFTGRNQI